MNEQPVFELAACESTILSEIAIPEMKRKDIAKTYALALRSSERGQIDWRKVNEAIVKRWSFSALTWIKEQAHSGKCFLKGRAMKVIDKDCLKRHSGPGRCDVCGKWCSNREAHHYHSRGSSGRLDIDLNLLAVGASLPFPVCPCHALIHAGKISRQRQLEVIAKREKLTVDELEQTLWWFVRRLPNGREPHG